MKTPAPSRLTTLRSFWRGSSMSYHIHFHSVVHSFIHSFIHSKRSFTNSQSLIGRNLVLFFLTSTHLEISLLKTDSYEVMYVKYNPLLSARQSLSLTRLPLSCEEVKGTSTTQTLFNELLFVVWYKNFRFAFNYFQALLGWEEKSELAMNFDIYFWNMAFFVFFTVF